MARSGSEGEPVLISASVDEHVEEQTGSYQDCKDDRQSHVIDGSGDPQHQGADSQDDQQQAGMKGLKATGMPYSPPALTAR
ncbi:hypothetical protein [Kocuria atrinae]|uniref:hypothetical protein n=1 Tax=Kocuria atrinae TaxID=592377 RepID=UPI001CB95641|nr:hypothetical protein [Kocuria atrinae]